ncbi:hypothetical protein C8R45DRAFT_923795 [Mycena sanguinolenta]|nr:hypothetical protein C8R45DRAFT_923795 [Mycena sanguinolenta]
MSWRSESLQTRHNNHYEPDMEIMEEVRAKKRSFKTIMYGLLCKETLGFENDACNPVQKKYYAEECTGCIQGVMEASTTVGYIQGQMRGHIHGIWMCPRINIKWMEASSGWRWMLPWMYPPGSRWTCPCMWTHPGQGVDASTVNKVDTSTGTSEEGWIHPEIQRWTRPRWVDVSICWGWMHPEVLMDASNVLKGREYWLVDHRGYLHIR